MPESIRIDGGGRSSGRVPRTLAAASGLTVAATPARAAFENPFAHAVELASAVANLDRHAFAALALTLGVVIFAVLAAIMYLRTRAELNEADALYRDEISSLKGALDRANTLLNTEQQVIVAWDTAGSEPDISGDTENFLSDGVAVDVLEFATWLDPAQSQALRRAIDSLRERGEGFALALTTLQGRPVEAEGRALGGRAVLRLREVSGLARQLAALGDGHRKLQDEVEALRLLVEHLPAPVWARDASGRLTFVNAAYAQSVEATSDKAVAGGLELFDRGAREELKLGVAGGSSYAKRLPAIVAGVRRVLDVLSVPTPHGSVGIGIDATEAEAMRGEIARMVDAHRSTLDQLATAVAIFDSRRRLTFYNAAYRTLWDLDAAFLDQGPTDSSLLEYLRAQRKLPEQPDFRQWRQQLHQAYQAVEAKVHEWHLPGGRTLRVVTTPNPEGGVTYLFDDVTERLDLERRFDALIRMQGETLDNLAEAVAVFGSDGRLRLSNPTFAQMWRLDPAALAQRPHIEAVIRWCAPLTGSDDIWQTLRMSVTALEDRGGMSRRIECTDGTVVDCSALPLPDGGTLVTFIDVTASVNVERALVDRNEALVQADKLKEDFLQHMSYELRSPLTNIIGFAYFLGDPKTGPLNDRQREYLGYITYSTNALLAIVDNILDIATIAAGAMTLDLGQVDIRQTMESAAEGVQDRLVTDGISLDIRAASDIGSFNADERRVRQILFNLLSNAVGFSPRGSKVTLAAERRPEAVVFAVSDQGPGIPEEMKDKVFDWFETNPLGSRHRGVGLGLSLVRSFVELHGGTVHIDSAAGRGTTVVCIFPHDPVAARTAAE